MKNKIQSPKEAQAGATLIALILLLASNLFFGNANAQTPSKKIISVRGVAVVQTQPQFPGGEDSLMSYLNTNMHYPKSAVDKRIHGTVYVSFIVAITGKIIDPKILNDANEDLSAEALRVVKLMPDWKPGTIAGNAVEMQFTLPINFTMPSAVLAKAER